MHGKNALYITIAVIIIFVLFFVVVSVPTVYDAMIQGAAAAASELKATFYSLLGY